MTWGRYEMLAAGISLLCIIASFILREIQTVLWIICAVTVADFILLLLSLFRRQHISAYTLLLFLFQLGLFCRAFFLMDQMPGVSNFYHKEIPLWYAWIGYTGSHVLQAFDLADIMELFNIRFYTDILPQTDMAKTALLALHASAGFFLLGFLFSFFNSPLFLTFPGGTAKRMILRALLAVSVCMGIYIWGINMGPGEWAQWLLFNIVTTLDVPDALPLFARSFALPLKTSMWMAGISILVRILFGLSLIGLLNRHILRFLASGDFIQKMSDIAVSPEYSTEKRVAAIQRLKQRKAVAESAIPGLAQLLADSSYPIRNAAGDALEKIDPAWAAGVHGRKVVPDLLKMLKSKDKEIRISAVRILGRMGGAAENAVPELLNLLTDKDAGLRRIIAESLEQIGSAAIPRLIRGLEKSDEEMTSGILQVLDQINPAWRQDERVLPEIRRYIRMMSDEDGSVRRAAYQIISVIGPESEEILPFLTEALSDNNTRRSALQLIGKMGSSARQVLPRLIDILAENDKSVTEPARQALESIDPEWRKSGEAKEAVRRFIDALAKGDDSDYEKPEAALLEIGFSAIPVLAEALADTDRNLQGKSAKILKAIHPAWPKTKEVVQAVPFLTAALGNENSYVRSSAAKVIGMIGPPAREAVPHLVKGMADTNKTVRATFKAALDRVMLKDHVFEEDQEKDQGAVIQSDREEVIRFVRELKDKDKSVRQNAVLSLGKLEPPPAEAVPHLLELLADGDRDVRQTVVMSLGTINHLWRETEDVGKLILPLLQAQTGEPSPYQHPAEAFSAIGRGAIRHLIPLTAESNKVILNSAVYFLEQIDPQWPRSEEAPAAVPALAEKLSAEQWFVRCSAAEILGKIGPPAKKAVPHLVKGLSDKNKQVRTTFKEAMDRILLKK